MRCEGLSSQARRGTRLGALAAALVVMVAAVTVGLTSRTTRVAVAAAAPPKIILNPTHGLAGSAVTISGFAINSGNCNPATYSFDGTQLLITHPPAGIALPAVTVSVPGGAAPGPTHTFSLLCVQASGNQATYTQPFTVDPPATTTTTAPAATTTTAAHSTPTTPGPTTVTVPGPWSWSSPAGRR